MASLDPFISREDLGDWIGQDLTSDDGALIAVDAACDMVRTIAEQTFNEVTDDQIVLDGSGTDALLLPERPVTEITSVTVDTTTLDTTDYVLRSDGVLLRKPSSTCWPWTWAPVWRAGRQNILVTYSHGYTADLFPRDVRMVALEIAGRLFKQTSGVTFEALGQYQVRYAGAASDVTKGEAMILRKYRTT